MTLSEVDHFIWRMHLSCSVCGHVDDIVIAGRDQEGIYVFQSILD